MIFKISRPRFWLYLLGPVLIAAGTLGGHTDLVTTVFFLVFCTLPANLLVYGVNDIFDFETDRINPKKGSYEHLLQKTDHPTVWKWIGGLLLPFVIGVWFLDWHAVVYAGLFVFFGVFYSAPPVRAKQVPFLDTLFNVLYILPGFAFYAAHTHTFGSAYVFGAGLLWCMAMHAFSAVPDIHADKNTGLHTVATVLGQTGTLLFCVVCYVGAAVLLGYTYSWVVSTALCSCYLVMLVLATRMGPFRVYKWYPVVNGILGFLVFLTLYFKTF